MDNESDNFGTQGNNNKTGSELSDDPPRNCKNRPKRRQTRISHVCGLCLLCLWTGFVHGDELGRELLQLADDRQGIPQNRVWMKEELSF